MEINEYSEYLVMDYLIIWQQISHFLVYKNATITIAFEIFSFQSKIQIGENKGLPKVALFLKSSKHVQNLSKVEEFSVLLYERIYKNANLQYKLIYAIMVYVTLFEKSILGRAFYEKTGQVIIWKIPTNWLFNSWSIFHLL